MDVRNRCGMLRNYSRSGGQAHGQGLWIQCVAAYVLRLLDLGCWACLSLGSSLLISGWGVLLSTQPPARCGFLPRCASVSRVLMDKAISGAGSNFTLTITVATCSSTKSTQAVQCQMNLSEVFTVLLRHFIYLLSAQPYKLQGRHLDWSSS